MEPVAPKNPRRALRAEKELLEFKLFSLYAETMPDLTIPLHVIQAWPLPMKTRQLALLEDLQTHYNKYKPSFTIQQLIQEPVIEPAMSFTIFKKLPIELRFKIWEFTFLSYLQPRTHCVREVRLPSPAGQDLESYENSDPIFISNQPVILSRIPHVCQESRAFYMSRTKSTFAYETFINFAVDTIYYCDQSPTREDWTRFLECQSTLKVRNLAMRSHVFCNLPCNAEEHFSNQHLEMTAYIGDWQKMSIVFDEKRPIEEIWSDVSMEFRGLSNKEKRKSLAVGTARKQTAYLTRFRKDPENKLRPINWQFVTIKK